MQLDLDALQRESKDKNWVLAIMIFPDGMYSYTPISRELWDDSPDIAAQMLVEHSELAVKNEGELGKLGQEPKTPLSAPEELKARLDKIRKEEWAILKELVELDEY